MFLSVVSCFYPTCQAAHSDAAGIYDPVLPHRANPSKTGPLSYPYPYYYDYDYRPVNQVRQLRPANPSPPRPESQSHSTGQQNNPFYPANFDQYQRQRSTASSGFHAANQLEFLGPIQSTNSNRPTNLNPKRPRRPHPRPTCTLMGLGGGGGSSMGKA